MSQTWARWANDPGLVDFYEAHRQRPEDLYPSERRFLPWLAEQSASVLDVGCASGGFADIWRHFHHEISYRGVDVSAPLVDSARRLRPEHEFLVGDCAAGLPLPAGSAEVVQALGWLHWEPRYRAALEELWRITERFLFFDVRVIAGDADLSTAEQRLDFDSGDASSTPYICVAWHGFAALLRDLGPARILGYGYWGEPAEGVTGVDRPVCFATFVLERPAADASRGGIAVALDLPLGWPAALDEGVAVLPPGSLQEHIGP